MEENDLLTGSVLSNGRTLRACNNCKRRKCKCSGSFPCDRCTRLGTPCVFEPSNLKRGRPTRKERWKSNQNKNDTAFSSKLSSMEVTSLGSTYQVLFINYFFDYIAAFIPILHKDLVLDKLYESTSSPETIRLFAALNACVAHFLARDDSWQLSSRPTLDDATTLYLRAIANNNLDKISDSLLSVDSLCPVVLMLVVSFGRGDTGMGGAYLNKATQMVKLFENDVKQMEKTVNAELKRRLWWVIFSIDRSITSLFHSNYKINTNLNHLFLPISDYVFQESRKSFSQGLLTYHEAKKSGQLHSSYAFYAIVIELFGRVTACYHDLTKRNTPQNPVNRYEIVSLSIEPEKIFSQWQVLRKDLETLSSHFPKNLNFVAIERRLNASNLDRQTDMIELQRQMNILMAFHYSRLMLYCPYALTLLIPMPMIPWVTADLREVTESASEMLVCARIIASPKYSASMSDPLCGGCLFITFMVNLSEYYLLRNQEMETNSLVVSRENALAELESLRVNMRLCFSAVMKMSNVWCTLQGLVDMMSYKLNKNGVLL